MAIEIYADLEEVAAEVAEVEVTAEVDAVDPIESEPTDAPEASSQEKETAEAPAEVETPTAAIQSTWTRTTDETDLLVQIYNAEFACARAEAIVEERKADLKEAKEHYDGCVDKLRELARRARNDSPANRPLFAGLDAKVEAVEESAPAEKEEPDTSWRATPITDLDDLTPAILEKLQESDIDELGKLADLIEQVETGKASWPKGIGKGKAEKIVNSLILWQENNGVGVDAVDSRDVPVTEVSTVYPTAEEWEGWEDGTQINWLSERALELEEAYPDASQVECDAGSWEAGTKAATNGEGIANCEIPPGPECDAWLLGWLWQSKQEDIEDDDPNAEE